VKLPAGLRSLAELAHPRTVKQLHMAGALGPTSPIALTAALPWLIGRGPSLGILSHMNALQVGHKTAIHDRWGSMTWRELDGAANRFGRSLAGAGFETGDRVALLLRNGREFATVLLGAQKFGFVACPMNTWARPEELAATLANLNPRLIVCDVLHADTLGRALDSTGSDARLVSAGSGDNRLPTSERLEDFMGSTAASPPFPFAADKGGARIIIHTSGTTGMPKGAKRDASAIGITVLANLLGVVPFRRSDVILCPAPMFHSFGLATFAFATALGATLVLPESFDAEDSLQLIEDHGATGAAFVPIMMRRIVDLGQDVHARYDMSLLSVVLASGSAMPPALRAKAAAVFGDVIYDLYGSTEVGWVSIATPEDMRDRPTTIGRPVPGIEVAVFTSEGRRLDAGFDGELFVRSGVVFEGYTSGDTRPNFGDYLSIGDVGHFDSDGYLYIEGRADDMIVIGGENVYPVEIEQVIESFDGVREAAVVPVPDEEFGQVVAAFVVGDVDDAAVRSHCTEKLASYKVPRIIEIVDALPRTGTGKVVKRELLERVRSEQGSDSSE
jgi:fatty-acyl-CoA synthase